MSGLSAVASRRLAAARQFLANVRAVAYRESRIVRHDVTMIGVLLAQPVIMMTIFGAIVSNEPHDVPWAVLDRSDTFASRKLVADIRATGYFVAPEPVTSYAHGRRLLHGGEALAMLVIPKDFASELERGRASTQLLLDGSDPLSSARVAGTIGATAAAFQARPSADRTSGPARSSGAVDIRQRFRFNATLRDRNFFLASLAGILLTNICFSAMAQGLVGEKEQGTYEQMLALPITALQIVIGKLLPHVVIAYGLLTATLLAVGLVFGVWITGSVTALILVSLPFILASLAIGVLVSALARTSAQAVFITVFFIMPSFVLSGSMMPYQLMPHGVREFGSIFPLRWYQIALRRIVERGAGLAEVLVPGMALLTIFLLLIVAVRFRMKPRLG